MMFRALLAVVFLTAQPAFAEDEGAPETLRVYIDADYTVSAGVAVSIELGLRAALASRGNAVAGHMIEVVPLDHRSNARRSISNLRRFDEDGTGIAVIGGMHSPPYIRHLTEINQRRIPLLLSWSAAAGLTRSAIGAENWVFRLSVDDRTVGPFLARQMFDAGCENIGVASIDNPWGRANHDAISSALQELGNPHVWDTLFSIELGRSEAQEIAWNVRAAGIDCLSMVAGNIGGDLAVNALDELGHEVRVFSHWGILGGQFTELVSHETRARLDLQLVHTCGLDPDRRHEATLNTALAAASERGEPYESLSDLPAPAGFVHGHDLGLLLMSAIEQAADDPHWGRSVYDRRWLFHQALENLDSEVQGILRAYVRPFAQVTRASQDAHEALSGSDLCLVRFDRDGRLVAAESRTLAEH